MVFPYFTQRSSHLSQEIYTFINNFFTLPPWTDEIIKQLQLKNVILSIQPFRSIEHLSFIPSKEFLIDIINKLQYLRVTNYTNTNNWI